jgi:hypothetical protein
MTEKHILLCQCTTGSIENKIKDLSNIVHEIRKNIGGKDVEVHPVIMTAVSSQQITSSLDNAINNDMKVGLENKDDSRFRHPQIHFVPNKGSIILLL